MSSLKNHLNNSINEDKRVDESFVLGAIVCTACIGYAFKGLAETDFMKSIGGGIGGLLSGVGGFFGGLFGRGKNNNNNDGDNKQKMNSGGDEEKELHALLKKKSEDLTPKEKARLKELSDKYDVSDILSDNEIAKLKKFTGDTDTDTDDETESPKTPKTDGEFSSDTMTGLLLLARKANEKAKSDSEKKENEAMLDLMAACTYDKDGKEIPMDQRLERMKGIVGEDKWEDFKTKMNDIYEKNKDSEEFKKALENVKSEISKKDVESFISESKERAKSTIEQIAKDKTEQVELEKKIAEIEKSLEGEKDPIDNMTPEEMRAELKKLKAQQAKAQQGGLLGRLQTALGIGETGGESETGGKPKDPKDYTDEEIESLQDEIAELDPENDKDKIKEKEDLLKNIAKAKGKGEKDFLVDTETGADGKVYQKKVGPKGGKYYRGKHDDGGWGVWQSGEPPKPKPTGQGGNNGGNNGGKKKNKKKNKKKKRIHDSYECTDISDFLFEKFDIIEYEE